MSVLRYKYNTHCSDDLSAPSQVLKTKGAHAISLYVTHAVFPEQSWERFTNDKEVDINTFWITDSLPHAIEIAQHLPFKLISLSEAIADSIQAD